MWSNMNRTYLIQWSWTILLPLDARPQWFSPRRRRCSLTCDIPATRRPKSATDQCYTTLQAPRIKWGQFPRIVYAGTSSTIPGRTAANPYRHWRISGDPSSRHQFNITNQKGGEHGLMEGIVTKDGGVEMHSRGARRIRWRWFTPVRNSWHSDWPCARRFLVLDRCFRANALVHTAGSKQWLRRGATLATISLFHGHDGIQLSLSLSPSISIEPGQAYGMRRRPRMHTPTYMWARRAVGCASWCTRMSWEVVEARRWSFLTGRAQESSSVVRMGGRPAGPIWQRH